MRRELEARGGGGRVGSGGSGGGGGGQGRGYERRGRPQMKRLQTCNSERVTLQ